MNLEEKSVQSVSGSDLVLDEEGRVDLQYVDNEGRRNGAEFFTKESDSDRFVQCRWEVEKVEGELNDGFSGSTLGLFESREWFLLPWKQKLQVSKLLAANVAPNAGHWGFESISTFVLNMQRVSEGDLVLAEDLYRESRISFRKSRAQRAREIETEKALGASFSPA